MQRSTLPLALFFSLITQYSVQAQPFVTATETPGASDLNIDGTGTASLTIVQVGDVVVDTTGESAHRLDITPNAITKALAGPDVTLEVTALVDPGGGTSTPSSASFSSGVYSVCIDGNTSTDFDVYIKYTPAPLQDPGSYSGSLDLSIQEDLSC